MGGQGVGGRAGGVKQIDQWATTAHLRASITSKSNMGFYSSQGQVH